MNAPATVLEQQLAQSIRAKSGAQRRGKGAAPQAEQAPADTADQDHSTDQGAGEAGDTDDDGNTAPGQPVAYGRSGIATVISPDHTEITFLVRGLEPLIVRVNALAGDILKRAVTHGIKQKVVDAAALSRNPDTGRSATLADKRAAMAEVVARITDPVAPAWNKQRGDGTGGAGTGAYLFRALVRLYPGKTDAQIRAWLDGKTPADQAKLRATGNVSAMIETIKAEDAARKGTVAQVDEAALFEGLE